MLGGESKHRLYHAPNAHFRILEEEASVTMECGRCENIEFSADFDMGIICRPDGVMCAICNEIKTTFMSVTVHLRDDDGGSDSSDSEDNCVDCILREIMDGRKHVELQMQEMRRSWADTMYGHGQNGLERQ